MVSALTYNCLGSLALVFMTLILLVFSNAAQGLERPAKFDLNKKTSVSIASAEYLDTDFAALAKLPKTYEPEAYAQALSMISGLKSSASCIRTATATLITSCQDIEGSTKKAHHGAEYPEILLNDVKSIYAARLAVCELVEANALVPPQCSALMPPESTKEDRGLAAYFARKKPSTKSSQNGLEGLESEKLVACLKSLESRPQWWTSYSNSRQNAVVICQAVRSDIEKDELLDLHQAMTEVTSDLGMALSIAVNRSTSQITSQKLFAQAVDAFQTQLQKDLVNARNSAEQLFSRLLEEMDIVAQRALSTVATTGQAVEAQYVGLAYNIQRSSEQVNEIQASVRSIFQEILRSSSELAVRQNDEWNLGRETVKDVMNALSLIRKEEINGIVAGLAVVGKELQTSQHSIAIVNQNFKDLNKQMHKMRQDVGNIEARAVKILSTQIQQLETQTRLGEFTEMQMQHLLQFIDQLTSKSINYSKMVDDAFAKMDEMSFLPNGLASLRKWFWLGPALVAIGIISKSTISYIVLLACITYGFYTSGLAEAMHRVWNGVPTMGILTTSLVQVRSVGPEAHHTSKTAMPSAEALAMLFCVGLSIYLAAKKVLRWFLRLNRTVPAIGATE